MVCVGDADRDDSMGKDAPEHPEDEAKGKAFNKPMKYFLTANWQQHDSLRISLHVPGLGLFALGN